MKTKTKNILFLTFAGLTTISLFLGMLTFNAIFLAPLFFIFIPLLKF